jgi:ferric-dicitrate binding protein FerR (iron transport regulator)
MDPMVIPIQRKKRSGVWLAAAAATAILVVAGLWVVKKDLFTSVYTSEQKTEAPTVYKDRQIIDLPDGTRVVLNANSELRFERSFGEGIREVSLTGEASFDVAHDASKPFIVHTGSVATKVLGTAFNINAWPGQQVTVTVIRGLVEVGDDQRTYDKISPDQQLVINVSSHEFVKKNTEAEKALAWQNNFLILQDVNMEEAAKIIGEKFNVEITLENETLKKCRIDGTFLNDEGLTEVLDLIGEVLNIKFTVEKEGKVVLRGKGCN